MITETVDYSTKHVRYGVQTVDHAFVSWEYENRVHAVAAMGERRVELSSGSYDFYDCWHRLICTDGVIEVDHHDGPALCYRRGGEGWTEVAVDPEFDERVDLAIDDALRALDGDHESELRAANALNTAEILFADHKSSC